MRCHGYKGAVNQRFVPDGPPKTGKKILKKKMINSQIIDNYDLCERQIEEMEGALSSVCFVLKKEQTEDMTYFPLCLGKSLLLRTAQLERHLDALDVWSIMIQFLIPELSHNQGTMQRRLMLVIQSPLELRVL